MVPVSPRRPEPCRRGGRRPCPTPRSTREEGGEDRPQYRDGGTKAGDAHDAPRHGLEQQLLAVLVEEAHLAPHARLEQAQREEPPLPAPGLEGGDDESVVKVEESHQVDDRRDGLPEKEGERDGRGPNNSCSEKQSDHELEEGVEVRLR